jgi:SAM-dependent methyltransferase
VSSAAELQGVAYDASADYRSGSPHLSHWRLNTRLTTLLRQHVVGLAAAGLPLTALEVGSGHGSFTEVLLSAGCTVTAVEASEPSVKVLNERFGLNRDFEALYTPDGALDVVDGTYSLGVCVSVLHHIPDYLEFLGNLTDRVAVGGSIVALQDPAWYPRMSSATHRFDRISFLVWRLGQGNYRRGVATISRRLRGELDETKPGDMVEYHVVRSGVDEQAVCEYLKQRFQNVELLPYWSHQMTIAQRIGEVLKLRNTFGVIASGRL